MLVALLQWQSQVAYVYRWCPAQLEGDFSLFRLDLRFKKSTDGKKTSFLFPIVNIPNHTLHVLLLTCLWSLTHANVPLYSVVVWSLGPLAKPEREHNLYIFSIYRGELRLKVYNKKKSQQKCIPYSSSNIFFSVFWIRQPLASSLLLSSQQWGCWLESTIFSFSLFFCFNNRTCLYIFNLHLDHNTHSEKHSSDTCCVMEYLCRAYEASRRIFLNIKRAVNARCVLRLRVLVSPPHLWLCVCMFLHVNVPCVLLCVCVCVIDVPPVVRSRVCVSVPGVCECS